LEVATGVAQTGVVGRLRGQVPGGPVVVVRADIDALPIVEATGAEYASHTPGVMHACGHDGHTSIALHIAAMFAGLAGQFAGELRFVFQPAEEVAGGALPMIESEVFGQPLLAGVSAAVGLHLWNSQPVGWVSAAAGPVMAAPDSFRIVITGRGGHAAAPHDTIDPVVVAAQLITALQTLVSRETNPNSQSVITIATVRAGTGVHNVIPSEAELLGTLRSFDMALRQRLQQRIAAMCEQLCAAFGASVTIDWQIGPPPVANHPELAARLRDLAATTAGVALVDASETTMGGDDMAEFLQRVPGVYFFVGSADPATGRDKPHHHPGFDIDDERALPLACELLAKLVWSVLSTPLANPL
jgi:amidohydrolase